MNRKKILFYHPMFSDGGAEKTNLLISEELSKKYEIIFLSNSFSNKFKDDIKKIGIKKIILKSNRTITSFFEVSKIIKKINPEIIFSVQMHANVLMLLINLFLFKNNLKILCCERLSPQSYHGNLKGKIILILANLLYQNARKIICNSKSLANEIKKLTKAKNIIHIYNPTLKQNLKKLASKFKINENPFKNKKNKKIIISIGRLDETKNPMMLLKAVNYVRNKQNLNVVFIGEGLKKDLIKYAKEINFSKNLYLLGFKNPFPYLLKSDLFILNSNFEGLPNVLIEAMSLNIPIISTESPSGPQEILLNGKAGFLVKRSDYKSLSNKINLFLDKPAIFNMKKKFYKQSLKRFSPNISQKKYLNIIKKII